MRLRLRYWRVLSEYGRSNSMDYSNNRRSRYMGIAIHFDRLGIKTDNATFQSLWIVLSIYGRPIQKEKVIGGTSWQINKYRY